MTEEIIIDGINVAGCEFYLQDEKYSCDLSFINQEELCNCDDVQDCTYKQLKRLQETLKHTENGRKEKANKLKRIEEIVTHCIQGGFTDEFIQEIFDICREYEEV